VYSDKVTPGAHAQHRSIAGSSRLQLLFRQTLFFIASVILPSGLLVALTLRMVVQDGELAEKRLADERRLFAADVRQELLAELDRIRLTAMSPSGVPAVAAPNPEIALMAQVEGPTRAAVGRGSPHDERARGSRAA
jgi:hypothetical protein